MGFFGGGFASGFTNTMALGQKIKQEREELEIRKKEADLRGKLIDLQMQKIQREVQSGRLLQDLLGQTETVSEPRTGAMLEPEAAGIMPETTTSPKPISRRSLAQAIAGSDPEKAAMIAAQPEPLTPKAIGKLMQSMMGVTPPAAAGAPTGEPPATPPAAAPTPSLQFVPSVSINKDGTLSVTLQGQRTNFQVSTLTKADPSGRGIIYERVFDPIAGAVVSERPIGIAPPPAELQKFTQAASAMGLQPGSQAHDFVVGRLIMLSGLPAEVQAQGLAQLETWAKGQGAPGAPSVSGAIGAAQQASTEKVGRETRVRKQVELEMEPLQGPDRTKYQMMLSAERQGHRLVEIFNPAFVGKGFATSQKAFRQAYQAEVAKQEQAAREQKYVPGALAGALRRFFGTASPEETEFRTTLLDMSDLLLRARSGLQINEEEYQRLRGTLPNLWDEPTVFMPALKRFVNEARQQREDIARIARTPASQLGEERPATAPTTPRRRSEIPPSLVGIAKSVRAGLDSGQMNPEQARRALTEAGAPPAAADDFIAEWRKSRGQRR